jgi:signal transduction histidine kinase
MKNKALAVKVRRIYLIAISAGLAVTLLCYLIIQDAYRRQQIRDWHQKLETVSTSQAPFLLQELVNDRFYAAAIRGREIHEENRDNGLEIGLYRTDGTPIYESDQVSQIREAIGDLAQAKEGLFDDAIYSTKELKFAGDTIGYVLLATHPSLAGHKELTRALWLTLFILLVVFLSIFVCLEFSIKRLVIRPTKILVESIPQLGSFLNGETQSIELPTDLGSTELTKVAEVLRDMGTRLRGSLAREKEIEIQAERSAAIAEISRQVAHDIRSPLTALSMAAGNFSLPEEQRLLLRGAVARINDIANNLVSQNVLVGANDHKSEISRQLIQPLVESLISEKRIQINDDSRISITQTFSTKSYGLFIAVDPSEFKRVLSNLFDNAIESFLGKGTVQIHIAATEQSIELVVEDNGRGITPELLPSLMQKGATHGKPNGSGLGLYHAKRCVELWGGNIKIESELGKGTRVALTLPRMAPPRWFISTLNLTNAGRVVILDDDESIHQVWRSRLGNLAMPVHHFRFAKDLEAWAIANRELSESSAFLIDYELRGQVASGLDVIEKLALGSRAVLVTSHFEETSIRLRCELARVKIVPKTMAGSIPITRLLQPVFERKQSST